VTLATHRYSYPIKLHVWIHKQPSRAPQLYAIGLCERIVKKVLNMYPIASAVCFIIQLKQILTV